MFLYNALVINITFVVLHTIGDQLIIPEQCPQHLHPLLAEIFRAMLQH
jgi:hypothetical protein